ncbi:hypothetical protein NC652_002435 [Populus alba x Populus x berolinensis]|nr:hypothetical protein NC652_002435 [Populus alba x Populus x berolinensis]
MLCMSTGREGCLILCLGFEFVIRKEL